MKAFHDSRDINCRSPYGVVECGTAVALALDVWEAPDATAVLRTWVDGKGERCFPMEAVSPTRHVIVFEPQEPGITWYYFIITTPEGERKTYGACDGRRGGVGCLRDWEPPSFQLSVCEPGVATDEAATDARLEEVEKRALGRTFAEEAAAFLCGEVPAPDFAEALETLRENCRACDWPRAIDLLGRANPEELLACLGAGNPGLAKARLWCAALFSDLGNESNGAGAFDSLDRWAAIDADCEAIVRNAEELRAALPLIDSAVPPLVAVNDDVLAAWLDNGDGQAVCVLVNTSLRHAYDVPVPMAGKAVSEVLGGYGVPVVEVDEVMEADDAVPVPVAFAGAKRYAQPHLYQLGTAVLYFHDAKQLARSMEPGIGILAHITSLPAADEAVEKAAGSAAPAPLGTIGAAARAFVDQLAEAGVRYWQILPLNPTDDHGSPYAGISAFAGNLRLLEDWPDLDDSSIDKADYKRFCEREADWLEPYACFMAIREKLGADLAWQDWPKKYRRFKHDMVKKDSDLRAAAKKQRRAQYIFDREWRALRDYAYERGVQIIGDMPIYVSADSADVWAHPEIFQLGADGRPEVVAGCPPDAFAVEGQVWGNPVYDWDAVREEGYAWWLRRLERAFNLYDVVRLDHFIGFARYFSIPAGEKALAGEYRMGPGIELFKAAYKKFGPLPIIAEDLGSITPSVRALVATCGFPGMDVLQFVDGGDPLAGYAPRPGKIVYTGTHDNHTLAGYCALRYPHLDAGEVADELAESAVTSGAPICVLPLQDVLGLDDDARMNEPGTTEGNWEWQADADQLAAATDRMRKFVFLHASKA